MPVREPRRTGPSRLVPAASEFAFRVLSVDGKAASIDGLAITRSGVDGSTRKVLAIPWNIAVKLASG